MAKTYHVILDFSIKVPDDWKKMDEEPEAGTVFVDSDGNYISIVAGIVKETPNKNIIIATPDIDLMYNEGVKLLSYNELWMEEDVE